MATKNFKNKTVKRVLSWMWWQIFCPILECVLCVVMLVLALVLLLISPVWLPIYALKNPEGLAVNFYSAPEKQRDDPWFLHFIYAVVVGFFGICRWLYSPLIRILPMKYRAEFIRHGKKRVCDYPTKVQIAYYKSHNDESKQELLSSNIFSPEVREYLWNDITERENWVESGLTLTKEQLRDFCTTSGQSLAWRYFKGHTPDKDTLNILLENARHGYAGAQYVLLELIKQQRPSAEFIGKLLSTGHDEFIKRVNEVIDQYADLDAVGCRVDDFSDDLSDEEKLKLMHERWLNFCKSKKDISRAAQKRMYYEQYQVFAQTGHRLEYGALQHLCLTVNETEYLKEIIENEYEQIGEALQTALKAAYWRYSVYLAVKQERKANIKK